MMQKYKQTSGVLSGLYQWTAICPVCEKTSDWRGMFDTKHIYKCPHCRWDFQVSKLYDKEGSEVQ